MNKKLITLLLTMGMLASSASAVLAADTTTASPAPEAGITETQDNTFAANAIADNAYTAEVVSVKDNTLSVKIEDSEYSFVLADETPVYAVDGTKKAVSDVKVGAAVTVFSTSALATKDIKAADAVVISGDEDAAASADVDTYLEGGVFGDVTNAKNTLALNVSDETEIVNADETKAAKADLAGKKLMVFYSITTMSIPAQTNPSKVVILGDGEVVEETPSEVTDENNYDVDCYGYEGTVKSLKDGLAVLSVSAEDGESEITFGITAETPIFSITGKTLENVKEGDKVTIFSDSPIKSKDIKDSKAVVVNDDETSNNSVTVDTFKNNDGSLADPYFTLLLNVADDAEIVDLKGEKAAKDKLDNKELLVFYSEMTASLPPMANPSKVVILGEGKDIKTPLTDATPAPTETPVKKPVDLTTVIKVEAGNFANEVKYDTDKNALMLPVRAVSEALGYTVTWDGATVTVGVDEAKFQIGCTACTKGTESFTLAQAPVNDNGTTYVSSDFFSEVLGKTLDTNDTTLVISK